MQSIQQQVIETLQTLSPTKQQEVLDFAEFLQSKQQEFPSEELPETQEVSFLEAAREYAGCLDGGPPDLSTNPAYMQGFGEE